LGINAVFHDPAAALVVNGEVVAATEEERFTRRKHGKSPVPFAAWELPTEAATWCLHRADLRPRDLDAVAYSYEPALVRHDQAGLDEGGWEPLRTMYAQRAPEFLAQALPDLDPAQVRFVPHHVAHAASAGLAASFRGQDTRDCAVLVVDGRGENASHLAGVYRDGELEILASQELPDSLGYFYEEATAHLGFRRSSDEYKVMALASYGTPRFRAAIGEHVRPGPAGGFHADRVDWPALVAARRPGDPLAAQHADVAASVQAVLEDVLLALVRWLHEASGQRRLALAGGVALNAVANTRIFAEGPFEEVWVPPAAGDAGTALGAALHVARTTGETVGLDRADLGREFGDAQIEQALGAAPVSCRRPADLVAEVAELLARNSVVAWFQGRAEYGPRALGRRSLFAHPGYAGTTRRLNEVKGREAFRPVAPMVLVERAVEIFGRGPLPSRFMVFVHDVDPEWQARIPAAVHVDGTARVQTVDRAAEPLLGRLLAEFAARTGLPVIINTSLNVAGAPIVDTPRDAVELLCSTRVDALAIGPFLVTRS
jgi:carbamoyltransferase